MLRRPPRSTRTDTLFPYTTLFRSSSEPDPALFPASLARRVVLPHLQQVAARPHSRHPSIDIGFRGACPHVSVRSSPGGFHRSEEHTSELQSLMRISYAVFCLKKKTTKKTDTGTILITDLYTN